MRTYNHCVVKNKIYLGLIYEMRIRAYKPTKKYTEIRARNKWQKPRVELVRNKNLLSVTASVKVIVWEHAKRVAYTHPPNGGVSNAMNPVVLPVTFSVGIQT